VPGIWKFIKYILCSVFEWIAGLFKNKSTEQHPEPFIISECLARTEKEYLEILEQQELVEKTIILWWGFDGLRLNEDGSLEWISRKKQNPEENSPKGQFCTIPQGIFDSSTHGQGYFIDVSVDIDNCLPKTKEFRQFVPYDIHQS